LAALAGAPLLGSLAAGPRRALAQQLLDLDVPFVTTPDNVVLTMLEMGRVGDGDFLLDLGSGDGRIVITAALKYGVRGRGIEIDPNLVVQSRDSARKAGVADRVEFVEQDLFLSDLTSADVITMYLLPDVNIKLRPRLLALRPGVRLVSHDWDMGDWQPDQSQEIAAPQKRLGLRKVARLMAWTVPARVGGRHRVVADDERSPGPSAASMPGPSAASAPAPSATSAPAPSAASVPPPSAASAPADVEIDIDQHYQLVAGGRVRLGGDDYRLATQPIDGGRVVLRGQARDGRPLTMSTTLARQSDTIDWRIELADRPAVALRTRRLPEPARPDDPLPGPG
ncbi:MAG: class I SAM-dependent methyltransferase, partial [Burkholderiaceae bacterium]